MTRRDLADFIVDLCLLMGAEIKTAYTVAGLFAGDPAIDDKKLAEFGRRRR